MAAETVSFSIPWEVLISPGLSVLSLCVSLVAVYFTWRRVQQGEEQAEQIERQSREMKRQGDEIERQSREIERQSEAMEREFATDIIVEDYEPEGNNMRLWLSNYGRGVGKGLELETAVLVDGDESFTIGNTSVLKLAEADADRNGSSVIRADSSMQLYEAEAMLTLRYADDNKQPRSFPTGIEELSAECIESLELLMNVESTDQLDNESSTQVFTQPQIASPDDIGSYPSVEAFISETNY